MRNSFSIVRITAIVMIALFLGACVSGGGGISQGSGGGQSSYGSASLSWLPPTENTDGSSLGNLAGYKIYYGSASGNYTDVIDINNIGIVDYLIENLASGYTYYFVVTAYDVDGNESGYSAEGSKTVTA